MLRWAIIVHFCRWKWASDCWGGQYWAKGAVDWVVRTVQPRSTWVGGREVWPLLETNRQFNWYDWFFFFHTALWSEKTSWRKFLGKQIPLLLGNHWLVFFSSYHIGGKFFGKILDKKIRVGRRRTRGVAFASLVTPFDRCPPSVAIAMIVLYCAPTAACAVCCRVSVSPKVVLQYW